MDAWLDLAAGLKSHRFFILLVFCATVLSTYLLMQVKTDLYETGASLLVKLGRENLEAPATVEKGSMVNTVGVRPEDIHTEISLLVSRDLIEDAVDEIGLEPFLAEPPPPETLLERIKYQVKQYIKGVQKQVNEFLISINLKQRLSDREKVIKGLQKAIEAVPGKESDVINIYMRTPNPALAERVLTTLLNLYLERRVQVRGNRNIRSFFDEQVETFQKQIRKIEDARRRTVSRMGVSSIPVQRELLLQRLHALYSELEKYRAERFMLTGGGKRRPPAKDNPLLGRKILATETDLEPMRRHIADLRIQRLELLRTYAKGAEKVAVLDQEIAAVEQRLLMTLTALIKKLQERVARLEKNLSRLNEAEMTLEALDRERKLAEQNYFSYNKRKEEARISEELDHRRVGNISIMTPVSSSFEPVSPRKLLTTMVSIPVGLLLGIALALLLEYLNDMIRSYRDLLRIPGTSYLGEFRRL